MAVDTVVRARLNGKIKKKATASLERMGLSASDAIRLLFVRIAEEGAMPFKIEQPNATTRAAMTDLEAGKGKRHKNVKALMDDLNA